MWWRFPRSPDKLAAPVYPVTGTPPL
jgi:hypothetical protein